MGSVLDAIADGVYGLDLDGRTTLVNPAAAVMLGYEPEELLEVLQHERIHHSHADGSPFHLEDCAIHDSIVNNVTRHVRGEVFWRKDGTCFPVEYTSVPCLDQGQVVGAVVTFRDITTALAAEAMALELARREAVQTVEKHFEGVIAAIPQQVWTARADGGLDWVSPQIGTYFGLPAEQIIEQGWMDVVHPEDLDGVVERWTASLASGEPYQAEFRLRRVDGQYRWHLSRAHRVGDQDARWCGTSTDIHERQLAEAAREELINIVSHDLRNPLNAILVTTQLLQLQSDEQSTSDHLRRIQRAGTQMNRLLADLLDVTRIDAGHLEVTPAESSVIELFDHVLGLMSPLAGAAKIQLLTRAEPIVGILDHHRMAQVLCNLVSNALRYTPEGGSVHLEAWNEPTLTVIQVKDTGKGIDPDHLPNLFERFWHHNSKDGVGLGLPIAKGIVDAHGGRIFAVDTRGAGATFRVELPRG